MNKLLLVSVLSVCLIGCGSSSDDTTPPVEVPPVTTPPVDREPPVDTTPPCTIDCDGESLPIDPDAPIDGGRAPSLPTLPPCTIDCDGEEKPPVDGDTDIEEGLNKDIDNAARRWGVDYETMETACTYFECDLSDLESIKFVAEAGLIHGNPEEGDKGVITFTLSDGSKILDPEYVLHYSPLENELVTIRYLDQAYSYEVAGHRMESRSRYYGDEFDDTWVTDYDECYNSYMCKPLEMHQMEDATSYGFFAYILVDGQSAGSVHGYLGGDAIKALHAVYLPTHSY